MGRGNVLLLIWKSREERCTYPPTPAKRLKL